MGKKSSSEHKESQTHYKDKDGTYKPTENELKRREEKKRGGSIKENESILKQALKAERVTMWQSDGDFKEFGWHATVTIKDKQTGFNKDRDVFLGKNKEEVNKKIENFKSSIEKLKKLQPGSYTIKK